MKYTEKVHFKTTPEQLALIDNIAKNYGNSRSATIRDMLNMFIMITESDITLRDLIVIATPKIGEQLIKKNVVTAYAVLKSCDHES